MARLIKNIIIAVSVVGCAIFAWNYLSLQRKVDQVLSDDSRNEGIKVIAHYGWFIDPGVLVFDLRQISRENRPIDVSRVLLQFAEKQKNHQFDRIVLSYKGSRKFQLKGDYFQLLGEEYEYQNPVYTLRTLPENVYQLDGSPAFGTWTGGVLGVVGKQLEDLNEFHRQWYLLDFAESDE